MQWKNAVGLEKLKHRTENREEMENSEELNEILRPL